MSLSPKERAYARELLAREERIWAKWSFTRWAAALIGIITLVVGITLITRGQQLAPDTSVRDAGAPASLVAVQNELIMTRSELTEFTRTCALFAAVGMGFVAAGLVIAGYTLTHWNSHLRDAIMVKAIREKFHEDLDPEPATSAVPATA